MLPLKRSVLVIGAGGLGCPALLHLAESGAVGLGIADPDVVERSNLPRQVLYTASDIGRPKTKAAEAALRRLSGGGSLEIRTHEQVIRGDEDFLSEYDVIIDATDRADVKLLLHDAIVRRGIPFVHAAASGWEGQGLSVAGAALRRARHPVAAEDSRSGSGCLRCLFGSEELEDPPDCARTGVAGPVVGLVGLLAAEEALRLAFDREGRWVRNFWKLDAKTGRAKNVRIEPDSSCPVCGK